MRTSVFVTACLVAVPGWAQPRVEAPGAQGVGYSTVGARPRVAVAPAPTPAPTVRPAPAPTTVSAGNATVSVISTTGAPTTPQVVATTTPGGARGSAAEVPAVTITTGPSPAPRVVPNAGGLSYLVGPDGNVVAVQRVPLVAADAGVDDPNVPTAGALYGGPLPGPSIAYMGIPVNTRRPNLAPPLAPGAVFPGHALPASTPPPPAGATPWVPFTTSGFQLGPSGASTETSGYGFAMPSGAVENPGTLRNPGR